MPKGEHLTREHQRAAAIRPRGPRVPRPSDLDPADHGEGESMDEALLRFQQAKADTEQLDAEKRALDVSRMRGDLIPADEARDEIEATHLRWVSELDQLPHSVASSLPPEIAASMREQIRSAIEAACLAVRNRIGS